jgi:DNA-binding response OmpR family regulator
MGISVPSETRVQTEVIAARLPYQTLLVVEDDEEIRMLLAQQLTKAGYLVLTASDGPTMFAALNAHAVDLIVLDLNLPGEDGLSLCRSTRSRRNIPIIMLTARSEAIDRIIGLEVGADDYISKPFDPREFLARVRSVMRRTCAAPGPAGSTAAEARLFSRLDARLCQSAADRCQRARCHVVGRRIQSAQIPCRTCQSGADP